MRYRYTMPLTLLVLFQVEAMRKRVSAADPAKCVSALEWDSITLEQFKQANLWTEGRDILLILRRA